MSHLVILILTLPNLNPEPDPNPNHNHNHNNPLIHAEMKYKELPEEATHLGIIYSELPPVSCLVLSCLVVSLDS